MREIIFDTETTGLDPASGHRLVEIGCIEMIGRVETGRTFHTYLNPRRSMPPEAQAVHGLSEQFLSDKPLFEDIVEDLLTFFGDDILVAHNAVFDMAFLDWELKACGRTALGLDRAIDTLAMARARHPGAKHSLDALCNRYGVDRSHRTLHGALLDSQLLAQVYVELRGGRQIGFELAPSVVARQSLPSSPAQKVTRPVLQDTLTPRPHQASETELKRHAAFIEGMRNPLWNTLGVFG